MTDAFEKKYATLDVLPLECSQTAAVLVEVLTDVAEKRLGKEQLLSAVVTDTGANIKRAAKDLGSDHVDCAAHVLQLAVNDVIGKDSPDTAVKRNVNKVQEVVRYVRHHVEPSPELERVQKADGVSFPLCLIPDVVTR